MEGEKEDEREKEWEAEREREIHCLVWNSSMIKGCRSIPVSGPYCKYWSDR